MYECEDTSAGFHDLFLNKYAVSDDRGEMWETRMRPIGRMQIGSGVDVHIFAGPLGLETSPPMGSRISRC